MAYSPKGIEQRAAIYDHYQKPKSADLKWVDVLRQTNPTLSPTSEGEGRYDLVNALSQMKDCIVDGLLLHRHTLEEVGVDLAETISLLDTETGTTGDKLVVEDKEFRTAVYDHALELQMTRVDQGIIYCYAIIQPVLNKRGEMVLVESTHFHPINNRARPFNFGCLGDQAKYCATLILAQNSF